MAEIVFYKDTNKALELTYKDEDGAVVDLSTHTASVKFYENENGQALLTLATGSGVTLAATEPNISIAFTTNQINALPKKGIIKVEITSGGITERVATESYSVLF
jgi:hypothetical protein